jgi:hypothetical protein
MSGGLDDALARMDRWEALRQRLAGSEGDRGEPVVDEVLEAIGTVLRRHGPRTVTVAVEGPDRVTTARLDWRDGHLTVERVTGGPGDPAPGGQHSTVLDGRIVDRPTALDGRIVDRPAVLDGRIAERLTGLEGRIAERPAVLDGRIAERPTVLDGRIGVDRSAGPAGDGPIVLDRPGERPVPYDRPLPPERLTALDGRGTPEDRAPDSRNPLDRSPDADRAASAGDGAPGAGPRGPRIPVDLPVKGPGRPVPIPEPEAVDQTAARLAELIRQDPSLLRRDNMTD